MARNKAIFDADILINLVKTNNFDYLTSQFQQIYVGDYVWENEIKEGTAEKRILSKLINQGIVVLLYYNKMTVRQQAIYREAYKILNQTGLSDYVDEGEKVTASFAKAHSVAYYMSDDNKAATYIKSYTEVAVINYCDLLFMAYVKDNEDVEKIEVCYQRYVDLFERGRLPRRIQDKKGEPLDFPMVMAKCSDNFSKNEKLKAFLLLYSKI